MSDFKKDQPVGVKGSYWNHPVVTRLYYRIKPVIPRGLQILARQAIAKRALRRFDSVWPIDERAGTPPEGWTGWPEGKQFALVLTHDVESEKGLKQCRKLAEMEMDLGFRSSFNFVVKKYETPVELRGFLKENGFEVGVHGCYHDGKLVSSMNIFQERAKIINQYLADWKSTGFRSPSMLSNLEWLGDLDIEYDLSSFDTDPFEPNPKSAGTIFPFLVPRKNGGFSFVEMPYTLAQDFTLFVLLGERTTDIWEKKLGWIAEKGGLVLLNVHPDYINFGSPSFAIDEYHYLIYKNFLKYIKKNYEGKYWHALPREVSDYVKSGSEGRVENSKP